MGICHGLHVKVKGHLCEVSFPSIILWVMDGSQVTGLCPLNHLFVSLIVVFFKTKPLMELAISTILSGQQTPGPYLS